MNEASQPPNPPGEMIAVMGLELEQVEAIVEEIGSDKVAVANINCPGQLILSGEGTAMKQAADSAREKGAKRCVTLNVSGAWHSPLMKPARTKMTRLIEQELTPANVTISGNIPVVANATAEPVYDLKGLCEPLSRQITAPVRWEACVRRLIDIAGYPGLPSGLDPKRKQELEPWPLFVEIGPGKVLRGLLRSIDRMLEVANVGDIVGIEQLNALV